MIIIMCAIGMLVAFGGGLMFVWWSIRKFDAECKLPRPTYQRNAPPEDNP